MNNGGIGSNPLSARHPNAERIEEGALIPVGVDIIWGSSVSPEIDGATIVIVKFECKKIGMGEDQPSEFVTLAMPEEAYLELTTTMSKQALDILVDRAAQ